MGIKSAIKDDFEQILDKNLYEYEIEEVYILRKQEMKGEWYVDVSVTIILPTPKGSNPNVKNRRSIEKTYHINRSDFNVNYSE